jgi:outer membrane protein OmpA-like peptidoglycan-associated protein
MRLTDLPFAPDSARILPEGMARIDSVGAVLLQYPMLRFEVGIHSDDRGETDRRFQLTRFRGRAVVQYIAAKFPTLNSKNYWFTGYGDSEPLASNKTDAGRAINRRVEFKLLNVNGLIQELDRRRALGTNPVPPAPGLEPRMPSEGSVPEPR